MSSRSLSVLTPANRAKAYYEARKVYNNAEVASKKAAKAAKAAGDDQGYKDNMAAAERAKAAADIASDKAMQDFDRHLDVGNPTTTQQSARQNINSSSSSSRQIGLSRNQQQGHQDYENSLDELISSDEDIDLTSPLYSHYLHRNKKSQKSSFPKSSTKPSRSTRTKKTRDQYSEDEEDIPTKGSPSIAAARHRSKQSMTEKRQGPFEVEEDVVNSNTDQQSYHATKRAASPSSLKSHPNKRSQPNYTSSSIYSSSTMMRPPLMAHKSSSIGPSIQDMIPSSPSMVYQPMQDYGTGYDQSFRQIDDYGRRQQDGEYSQGSMHSNKPSNTYQSAGYPQSHQRYTPYDLNSPPYQNLPYGHQSAYSPPDKSSRLSRYPKIDTTPKPKPRAGKRSSPSLANAREPSEEDEDRFLKSPPCKSEQQQKSRKKNSQPSVLPNKKQSEDELEDELPQHYPFSDGGIPGEGGSSSDEGLMIDPQVVGRQTFQGGFRGAQKIIAAAVATPDDYKPYKPQTHAEVLAGFAVRHRRRLKLLSREMKAEWDKAKANNDEEGMWAVLDNIEYWKKRNMVIPSRIDLEESGNPISAPKSHQPRQSSIPVSPSATQGQLDIRTPRRNAIVPDIGIDNINQDRTADWIRQNTEAQLHGGSSDSHTNPCPEESAPFEKVPRHGSQLGIEADGTFQAAETLPETSVTFHENSRKGHGDAQGSAAQDRHATIPAFRAQLNEYPLQNKSIQPPTVISLSSTESAPAFVPSVSMKDRLPPPTTKKATKRLPQAKVKNNAEKPSTEEARQQKIAYQTVASELKAANEELNKDLFGEDVGSHDDDLTADQLEHRAELMRKEKQRKEEAKLRAEIDKENNRIMEATKQQEIAEARKQEMMLKDREEISKKQKREVERKRLLAAEEQVKEEKRKQAAERIKAQRAKDKADAEAREKEAEKSKTIEADHLRLELLRSELKVRRLQAASLTIAKASGSDTSKNLAKVIPSNEEENPLFVSEDLDMVDADNPSLSQSMDTEARSASELFVKRGNFRSMMAEDREREKEVRDLEAIKRSEACRARLAIYRQPTVPQSAVIETPKRSTPAKKSRAVPTRATSEVPQQNTLASFLAPLITDPSNDTQPTQPVKGKRMAKRPASVPTAPTPPSPKTYLSIVQPLTLAQLDLNKSARDALYEAKKLKHLEERRAKQLPIIAERHKLRILKEAEEGGITLADQEVQNRVNLAMKKLEVAYQRKQAKKGTSLTIAEPKIGQEPTSFSTISSEHGQNNSQEPNRGDITESFNSQRRPGSRYTKKTVRDLQENLTQADLDELASDSETESEDDPDDEDMLAAMAAVKRAGTSNESEAAGGVLNPSDAAPDQEGMTASNEFQCQKSGSSGSLSKPNATNSKSVKPKEKQQIRIYTVTKTEIRDGEQLPEVRTQLHNRDEANEMAKDLIKDYRQAAITAGVEEESSSKKDKDGLLSLKIVLDNGNSLNVEVTSEFADPATYGLDPDKLNNRWEEQVWVIRRELKRTTVADGHTTTECIKEELNNVVYTDRSYANSHACEYLVNYLRPPQTYAAAYEVAWSQEWVPSIRASLEAFETTSGLFDVALDLDGREDEDGDKALDIIWISWDEIRVSVEVRKTKGPRN